MQQKLPWGLDQTQQSIFQDVEPLTLSVVDRYNACIFAYGQMKVASDFLHGFSNRD